MRRKRRGSSPSTSTSPSSGSRAPVIIRIVVVLPAPDGPTMPRIVPAGTERSIPNTPAPSPKSRVAWLSTTSGVPPATAGRVTGSLVVPALGTSGGSGGAAGGSPGSPAGDGSAWGCTGSLRGGRRQTRPDRHRAGAGLASAPAGEPPDASTAYRATLQGTRE